MADTTSNNPKAYAEGLAAQELKRKIIQIAKRLFLKPKEEGVQSKQKAPSKKQIMAELTDEEIEFFQKSIENKLSDTTPESVFWNAYDSRDMDLRRKVLLRMVTGDHILQIEKDFLDTHGRLPSIEEKHEQLSPDEKAILLEMPAAIESTEAALMLLSPQDKEYYFRNGTLNSSKQDLDEADRRRAYEQYINEQQPYFEAYLQFVDKLLCELKRYRIVHDNTTLSARIKSVDSAFINDPKKALDDCFGLCISFSTEAEKELVETIISSTIAITKQKYHDKPNGYKAYHCSGQPSCFFEQFNNTQLYKTLQEKFSISDSTNGIPNSFFVNKLLQNIASIVDVYKRNITEQAEKTINSHTGQKTDIHYAIPSVEWQFKTIAVAIDSNLGDASHQVYKDETTDEIQTKYTEILRLTGTIPASLVPIMWESTLNGKGPIQLTPMETLKKLYPFFIDPKDLDENPPQIPHNRQAAGFSHGD